MDQAILKPPVPFSHFPSSVHFVFSFHTRISMYSFDFPVSLTGLSGPRGWSASRVPATFSCSRATGRATPCALPTSRSTRTSRTNPPSRRSSGSRRGTWRAAATDSSRKSAPKSEVWTRWEIKAKENQHGIDKYQGSLLFNVAPSQASFWSKVKERGKENNKIRIYIELFTLPIFFFFFFSFISFFPDRKEETNHACITKRKWWNRNTFCTNTHTKKTKHNQAN